MQPSEGRLAHHQAVLAFGADEQELKNRLQGTVFHPAALSFPGLITPAQLARDIGHQFSPMQVPDEVFSQWHSDELSESVKRLQTFWIWTQQRGLHPLDQGPEWKAQRMRAQMQASLGTQRYAANAKHGLDHIIEPGLGKEEHMRRALKLRSPFSVHHCCDSDLSFTAVAVAAMGPHLSAWIDTQLQAIRQLKRALLPLENFLRSAMGSNSRQVAADSSPGFIAAVTSLLRWPDRTQAVSYVRGFGIVDQIDNSHIFLSLIHI